MNKYIISILAMFMLSFDCAMAEDPGCGPCEEPNDPKERHHGGPPCVPKPDGSTCDQGICCAGLCKELKCTRWVRCPIQTDYKYTELPWGEWTYVSHKCISGLDKIRIKFRKERYAEIYECWRTDACRYCQSDCSGRHNKKEQIEGAQIRCFTDKKLIDSKEEERTYNSAGSDDDPSLGDILDAIEAAKLFNLFCTP